MEKLYELLQRVTEMQQPVGIPEKLNELRGQLEAYINTLIQYDFPKLVELLYRIDVNEKRLKELLALQNNTDSATLLADLLIERQLQKQAWRQASPPNTDIPEEDRW